MIEVFLLCLALNIYHEGRGEPWQGQVAIAQVTIRRAEFKAENICKVVYAPQQFSWVDQKPPKPNYRSADWQYSLAIAKYADLWMVYGIGEDYSKGASHYHARYWKGKLLKPYWIKDMKKTVEWGNHLFYLEKTITQKLSLLL